MLIETAKPLIDIYYWGSMTIEHHLQYYNDRLVNQKINSGPGGLFANLPDNLIKEIKEGSNREREEYNIFNECYNRKLAIKNDMLLIRDKWDKENEYLEYNVTLSL
ncbi:hypothetical protein IDJ75_02565 [Mucilaginibacter rigui]|uniref:Uncharacterized protein n=1 Tax=Mucilaginibacter rigui TaxID=534635 RepID=A0ABR7X0M2_9SPHI|nr:hypothetical protein [Mucilaginibacter rigui]MBD1384147.1 hypothetical protein [Mucilaginibacter rigui]